MDLFSSVDKRKPSLFLDTVTHIFNLKPWEGGGRRAVNLSSAWVSQDDPVSKKKKYLSTNSLFVIDFCSVFRVNCKGSWTPHSKRFKAQGKL